MLRFSFKIVLFIFLILISGGKNFVSANDSISPQLNYKIEKLKYLQYYHPQSLDEALFYNLAYISYHKKSFIESLFYFEKARLINPFNKDITYNIKLVREQVKGSDRINEHFFLQSFRYLLNYFSELTWFFWAIFFLTLSLLTFYLYRFHKTLKIYRLVYFVSLIHFFVVLIFLIERKTNFILPQYAIVFSENTQLYQTPSPQGKIISELIEGDKIEVLGELNDYYIVKQNAKELFVWKGAVKIL